MVNNKYFWQFPKKEELGLAPIIFTRLLQISIGKDVQDIQSTLQVCLHT